MKNDTAPALPLFTFVFPDGMRLTDAGESAEAVRAKLVACGWEMEFATLEA